MEDRASYLVHLKEVLPPYVERAGEVSALIGKAYEGHGSLKASEAT